MTVTLSAFQKTILSDVIRQHEQAATHDEHCCEVARRFKDQLSAAAPVEAPKPPAQRSASANFARTDKMASQKQIDYIRGLMSKRSHTNAERLDWNWQLDDGMSSRTASGIIQVLLARGLVMEDPTQVPAQDIVRMATEKQIDYIVNMAQTREWTQEGPRADIIRSVMKGEQVGAKEASMVIEYLVKCPKTPKVEIGEEGIYFFQGVYYKVQRAVHGSGELYSKRFDAETQTWSRGGRLSALTAKYKVTREQAQQFGELYGCCIKCHQTLTDEESIERGMGKTCAANMGF